MRKAFYIPFPNEVLPLKQHLLPSFNKLPPVTTKMGTTNSKLPPNTHLPASMTNGTQPFPRRFSATYKKSLTKILALLTDADRPNSPSYAISWPSGSYGSLTFHAGPTKDHELLATVRLAGRLGSDFNVALPALFTGGEQKTEILRYVPSFKREMWWFAMPVGSGADVRIERFEWRRSRGAEVKGVEGGSGSGWKLVRMGGQMASDTGHRDDEADDDDGRIEGFTSDGKEVVAVWADAGLSFHLSRIGGLEFRGSGATGELGLLWSVMAVVTCMCIYQLQLQRATSAAASAAA